jgi:hypothetical protein
MSTPPNKVDLPTFFVFSHASYRNSHLPKVIPVAIVSEIVGDSYAHVLATYSAIPLDLFHHNLIRPLSRYVYLRHLELAAFELPQFAIFSIICWILCRGQDFESKAIYNLGRAKGLNLEDRQVYRLGPFRPPPICTNSLPPSFHEVYNLYLSRKPARQCD